MPDMSMSCNDDALLAAVCEVRMKQQPGIGIAVGNTTQWFRMNLWHPPALSSVEPLKKKVNSPTSSCMIGSDVAFRKPSAKHSAEVSWIANKGQTDYPDNITISLPVNRPWTNTAM